MTTPLPRVSEAINQGGSASVAWRNWFEAVNRAIESSQFDPSALQADIAALATALGSPDGSVAGVATDFLDANARVIAGPGLEATGSLGAGSVTLSVARGPLFGCSFDGGGSDISAGSVCDVYVPYGCQIQAVTLLSEQVGSLVIDVWVDDYANFPPDVSDTITASAKPTLLATNKYQDTTLTGWTVTVPAGSAVRFNVDSCSGVERAHLILEGIKI